MEFPNPKFVLKDTYGSPIDELENQVTCGLSFVYLDDTKTYSGNCKYANFKS